MIRLTRLPLSKDTEKVLAERAKQVSQAPLANQQEQARELFKSKSNLAFEEVRSVLKWMNGGSEVCMYCQHNEGNAIDHFEPIQKKPNGAFTWSNYLWACDICNSNQKRDQFPNENGRALLVNPVNEDPLEYLSLTPTGEFDLRLEEPNEKADQRISRLKNNHTIDVFRLNNRESLRKRRKKYWIYLTRLRLRDYQNAHAQGNESIKSEIKNECRHAPLAGVLAQLWQIYESSDHRELLIGREACLIFEKHPEIADWFAPDQRANPTLKQALDKLVNERITGVKQDPDRLLIHFDQQTIFMKNQRCWKDDYEVKATELKGRKLKRVELDQGLTIFVFHGYRLHVPFYPDQLWV